MPDCLANSRQEKIVYARGAPADPQAWVLPETLKALETKFPMIPGPQGAVVLVTTPLGEKVIINVQLRSKNLNEP